MTELATPGQQRYLRGYALRAPISTDERRRILRIVNDRLTLDEFVRALARLRRAEALLEHRATPVEPSPGPPTDTESSPPAGTPIVRTPLEAIRAERYFHRIKCEAQREHPAPKPLGPCDECGTQEAVTVHADSELEAIFDIDSTIALCAACALSATSAGSPA
jgi:hypothetical protein